jgi:hypothetical protein
MNALTATEAAGILADQGAAVLSRAATRNAAMKGPAQLDLFADVPRGARPSRGPKRPPLDEARLEMKLAGARQRVRNLIVLGMNPAVSGEAREAVRNMERWTRAEVRVHIRVLKRFRERQRLRQQ